jgi:hypothetical protein
MLTNWGDLLTNVPASGGSTDAGDLTSGTLDSARLPTVPYTKGGTGLAALGTALQVLRTNAGATAAEWATITAGLSWTSPTTNALGRYSGGAIVDAAISDDGTNVSITRAPRVTLSGTTYLGLTSAGLAINKGTTAASKMLEVVDSAAAQLRLTHTAATDYADFTVDTDGYLAIDPSGGRLSVGSSAFGVVTTLNEYGVFHSVKATSRELAVAAPSVIYFSANNITSYHAILRSTGLLVGTMGSASDGASKMLEVRDTAAAQLRLTHTAATDYADFTVDTDGHLTIDPTGNIVLAGANRATYDASPSATTIRDILISHGLMAAS